MRLLTMIFILSVLIFADSDEHERHEYREYHMPLDMRYLELNAQQHHDVKAIIKSFRKEHKAYHEVERSLRHEMAELFRSDTFNRQEYLERTAELKQRSAEIEARFFERIHQVLTPIQRAHFVDFMEEWDVE